MTWERQSAAEVELCPGCDEVEQVQKMIPAPAAMVGEESSEGTIERGWLVCRACARAWRRRTER